MRPRILLHVCCGICAIYPTAWLQEQGFEVTALFYNPNIHPLQEYVRRARGMETAAENAGIRLIRKDNEYNPATYLRQVVFRENQRCFLCYQHRLERTASIARKGGFDCFSSTLLFSKKQKHQMIKSTGESLGSAGCSFYYHDFRTGWDYGQSKSRRLGIYRQNYCGCIYSEFERFQKELS